MKKIIYTTALCLTGMHLYAQQVPNGGFEEWTDFMMYEDPTDWGSMNMMSMLGGPEVATKTTDSHSGTYALQLAAGVEDIGQDGEMDTVPGLIMLGNLIESAGNTTAGLPFTHRPDSLVGWYKLTSPQGDGFLMLVALSRWDNASNSQVTVAATQFSANTTIGTYQRFAVPFVYDDSNAPDSLQIIITSSINDDYSENSVQLDDLGFIYNSTAGISELTNDLLVYPNPALDQLFVKGANTGDLLRILDLNGKVVLEETCSGKNVSINVSGLPAGMYTYECIQQKTSISRGKFTKQ
jgi:hypothetical protein